MRRREFIEESMLGAAAACQSPIAWNLYETLGLPEFQQSAPLPPQAHFADLAQYEEGKHPLPAGRFDEALKVLIPAVKERRGIGPYTVAIVYLRMERYREGIPFALQACRDTPDDLSYQLA